MKVRIPADFLQIAARWLVSNVEAILLMCTPLLSILPSMFAAIRALDKGDWPQANLIGGIIEALGLASGAFIGIVEDHNQRHPDKQIGKRWGYGVFIFYLIVVEAIIISHTPEPVPILLPGLTVVGSVIVGFRRLMLRADEQKALETAKQDAKEQTEAERDNAEFEFDMDIRRKEAEQRLMLQQLEHEQRLTLERLKVEAKLSQPTVSRRVPETKHEPVSQDSEARQDAILRHLKDKGDTGPSDIARNINASRATVYRDLDELLQQGRVRKVPKEDNPDQFKWEPSFSTNGHTKEAAQ